jgi:hypothetical protein
MWGLNNWEPNFVETTEGVLGLCRQIYPDIIGHELECSWVPWLQTDDKWWEGAPVILRINGVNYEICWSKESDCAIARNTINVLEPVRWCDCDELAFSWKQDALTILQDVVGQKVTMLHLEEAQVTMGYPTGGGFYNQYWVPHGINFSFSSAFLSVYNAFDKNEITNRSEEQEGIRLISI